MMGIGSVINKFSGPDVDGSAGLVYRLGIGRGSPAEHNASPHLARAPFIAIVDAAQTSQAAMEAHIQANHPAVWAWLSGLGAQDRVDLHTATAALRGL
jgi:hypothetical protein